MLRVRSLDAGYGKLRVLRGVSLHVRPGEIVTIIGANGAGKTTLLSTIAGLIKPQSGSIVFDDKEVSGIAPERMVKAGCAVVPEGRQVFAPLTVRENLVLGAYSRAGRKHRRAVQEDLERVLELFPRLRERRMQLAGTLSGGEQQMLAMARALMARPRLLMLDEPSMGLAPLIVKSIFETIVRLRDEGNTILLVEQNARAALGIADRGYVMETGQIVLDESAERLLDNMEVQRAYLGKEYARIDE
ncbi:MAG: ATP-binding cassette domain-containing protein [Chitinivibrionales bacterium]|nr:ATP-binding cassette domain-containing protein [Chitinivibrionales bacterium]